MNRQGVETRVPEWLAGGVHPARGFPPAGLRPEDAGLSPEDAGLSPEDAGLSPEDSGEKRF